jgi:hypothetical protein
MVSLIAASLTTLLLLVSRLDLARVLGLGDVEALYLAYGLHPQAAYFDQPGLIGGLASAVGVHVSARVLHTLVAFAATGMPWVGVLAARACGADFKRALYAYFPLALLPALAIGAAAFVPELPFAFCWLLTLACAGWALRHPPLGFRTLLASLGAGAFAALACLSMTGGWLLALSVFGAWLGGGQRRARTLAPWAALGLFGILVAPLVRWWLSHGSDLLLVHASDGLGAVARLLRPLVFATPAFLYAGWVVARAAFSQPRPEAADRLLRHVLVVPLVPFALLAGLGIVDVDWLMPAYLTLPLLVARNAPLRPGLVKSCLVVGWAIALLGWGWLRTPLPVWMGQAFGGYDPAQDSSNDFYAWGPARQLLSAAVDQVEDRTGQTPIVIGQHWAVCAQAEVALKGRVHVGCDSVELDDYDSWSSPESWSNAQTILYVSDSRFSDSPPEMFLGRPSLRVQSTTLERFGRSVRRIDVSEFDRSEANAQALGAWMANPARSSRARSSAESGLGVVSSLSP